MLNSFDWLRLCRTGAELLATLRFLEREPDLFPAGGEIGPPRSALDGPCKRCWVYPRLSSPRRSFCPSCQAVMARAGRLGNLSRQSIVIWSHVNQLPKHLWAREGFYKKHILGSYVHGQHHFLLMMRRRKLKPWLQELLLYHGPNLKGLIQVLPTSGAKKLTAMGELLCRAMHHEARFSMDQLRVRFFSAPYQLLMPHNRDRKGLLTFEVTDFLSLLEMAAVFRTILLPDEQQSLYDLLNLENPAEEQFYWGRFMGLLNQEARDMLSAWRIRQWPHNRVKLLYELVEYVAFYQTD
ncbi:MAG: hypothetical protein DRI48_06315 [Chloroflexi bacterium]|nr:MAG: hypothetical protein DRI48_06315 [Chloroflexota bacterium]